MDVTTETFEQEVLQRSHEKPVVVDFWAAWCGPCRALGPVLEEETAVRAGDLELVKVDVDSNQELALQYGIQGIPAVKAYRNGQVVAEFVGALPRPMVAEFLDGLSGPSGAEQVAAELRSAGELPEVVSAVDAGDNERALGLLMDAISSATDGERDRLRVLAVLLFGDLGPEHPVTVRYRRQLAAALY